MIFKQMIKMHMVSTRWKRVKKIRRGFFFADVQFRIKCRLHKRSFFIEKVKTCFFG